MKVLLNGEPPELARGATRRRPCSRPASSVPDRGVAVALDGEVVPRGEWRRTTLHEGARVEVLRRDPGRLTDGITAGHAQIGGRELDLAADRSAPAASARSSRWRRRSSATGTEIVTVALRRIDPGAEGSVLDVLDRARRLRSCPTPPAASPPATRSAPPSSPARRSRPTGSSSR